MNSTNVHHAIKNTRHGSFTTSSSVDSDSLRRFSGSWETGKSDRAGNTSTDFVPDLTNNSNNSKIMDTTEAATAVNRSLGFPLPPGMTRPQIKRRSAPELPNLHRQSSLDRLLLGQSFPERIGRSASWSSLQEKNRRNSFTTKNAIKVKRQAEEVRQRELRDATYQLLLEHFQLRKFSIHDFAHPRHPTESPKLRDIEHLIEHHDDNAVVGGQQLINNHSISQYNEADGAGPEGAPLAHKDDITENQISLTNSFRGLNTEAPVVPTDTFGRDHGSDTNITIPTTQVNSGTLNLFHRTLSRAGRRTKKEIRRHGARAHRRFSLRRIVRRLRKALLKKIRHLGRGMLSPLPPIGIVARARMIALGLIAAFQIFYIPLVPAYFASGVFDLVDSDLIQTMRHVNMVIEVIFMADLLLGLNTSYFDPVSGKLVCSRKRIALHYLRTWLVPDLLSSLPMELAETALGSSNPTSSRSTAIERIVVHCLFQFPRFVSTAKMFGRIWNVCRAARLGRAVYAWLYYSRYAHLMRITIMIFLVLLTAHYIACGWRVVSRKHSLLTPSGIRVQYIADVYYAMLLIQGQGDPVASTAEQNAYSIFAVLLGSLMIAIVFANVTVLVSDFNANSTNYQRKMEVVHATMDKMQLPQELKDRVQHYYGHLRQRYDSLDGEIDSFMKELTPTLALEVGLFKYMNLIVKVPYWGSCSPDFVAQIVRSLAVQIYMPDDYVVRRGEVRRELFMVNRGKCECSQAIFLFDRPSLEGDERVKMGSDLTTSASQPTLSSLENLSPTIRKRHFQKRRATRTANHPSASVSKYDSMSSNSSSSDNPFDRTDLNDRISSSWSAVVQPTAQTDSNERIHTFSAGKAFGEMALLANYEQPANIRASTYAEICILQRSTFQKLLVQFPNDRREVLSAMLRSSIEHKTLPLSWVEVLEIVANSRGGAVSWQDVAHAPPLDDEIERVLMGMIDREVIDDSIVFGFSNNWKSNDEDKTLPTRCSSFTGSHTTSSSNGSTGDPLSSKAQLASMLAASLPKRQYFASESDDSQFRPFNEHSSTSSQPHAILETTFNILKSRPIRKLRRHSSLGSIGSSRRRVNLDECASSLQAAINAIEVEINNFAESQQKLIILVERQMALSAIFAPDPNLRSSSSPATTTTSRMALSAIFAPDPNLRSSSSPATTTTSRFKPLSPQRIEIPLDPRCGSLSAEHRRHGLQRSLSVISPSFSVTKNTGAKVNWLGAEGAQSAQDQNSPLRSIMRLSAAKDMKPSTLVEQLYDCSPVSSPSANGNVAHGAGLL